MTIAEQIKAVREKRCTILARAKEMLDKCAGENRSLTTEEEQHFDTNHLDAEKLAGQVQRLEKQEVAEWSLAERQTLVDPNTRSSTGNGETRTTLASDERETWRSFLRVGPNGMAANQLAELRALGVGTGSSGGYLAPSMVTTEFVKILRDFAPLRTAPCRIIPTMTGQALPFPTVSDTANTGELTAEGVALTDTNDPTLGQISFGAYGYNSGIVIVSKQLLIDSVVPVEQLLNELMAERIGVALNTAYTIGNGSTAPQGIVTGSAKGADLPVSSLGADAEAVWSNINTLAFSIAETYRRRPSFGLMMASATVLALKKLVDTTKRPVWTPGFAAGEPERIAGYPYYTNSAMAAVGVSTKPLIAADFSQFYVRDVATVEVIRLDERFAEKLQVGFLAWFRSDSKVMNSGAIKHALCAAS